MDILIKFLVSVHNGQTDIQIVRVRNVSDITQSCGYVLNVYFGTVRSRTEFLRMLLNYESTCNDVVLLSAPKITVEIKPKIFL